MGNLVREMLDMAQLSVMDAAVYSGVPKSNIYRYLSGEAEPTLAVLEEIARACNLSLDIAPQRLSDPYAAQAVKIMLEPTDSEAPSEVLSWIERITRRHPHNDYDIIHIGGLAAAPTYRQGAHYFRGDIHTLTVASAGDFTNKNWALSGAPVLESLNLSGGSIPVVLWAEDADLAAGALKQSATELPHPDGANILIVPAHHGECDGSIAMAGVRLVSVLQGLIDVVSFGDEAAGLVRTYLEREV